MGKQSSIARGGCAMGGGKKGCWSDTQIEIEGMDVRSLAAAIIKDAVNNIRRRSFNAGFGIDWRRDLRWLLNPDSNFHWWALLCDIDVAKVRREIFRVANLEADELDSLLLCADA